MKMRRNSSFAERLHMLNILNDTGLKNANQIEMMNQQVQGPAVEDDGNTKEKDSL